MLLMGQLSANCLDYAEHYCVKVMLCVDLEGAVFQNTIVSFDGRRCHRTHRVFDGMAVVTCVLRFVRGELALQLDDCVAACSADDFQRLFLVEELGEKSVALVPFLFCLNAAAQAEQPQ